MGLVLFLLVVLVVFAGLGRAIGRGLGGFLFPEEKEKNPTFVDKSIHHHYHSHEHKNISIIDDETKKKIFELKENNEKK